MDERKSITVDLAGRYPLYRIVDGERVPIDAADPNHLYKTVENVQTGEIYTIEYTEAEEAEARAQKIAWDEAAPERQAEEERQAKEARKFDESLKFRIRIVAFIDILGWAAAVNRAEHEEQAVKSLGHALSVLTQFATMHNSLWGSTSEEIYSGYPVMTQFSDSLLVSVDDDRFGRDTLASMLGWLSLNLARFGFLLRGGVAKGGVFHTQGMVFGPALNKAYMLESRAAIMPRVILCPELAADWEKDGLLKIDELGVQPWKLGPDGYRFFDFIPPWQGNSFLRRKDIWESHTKAYRELILKMAADPKCSDDVFAKYEWLAGYFDSVCVRYPEIDLKPVSQEAKILRWARVSGPTAR